uniref:Uncharacterized protein n=1 Tax=Salix viminalis TaxID=40686 RepID=A0A6N2N9H9_SALVM
MTILAGCESPKFSLLQLSWDYYGGSQIVEALKICRIRQGSCSSLLFSGDFFLYSQRSSHFPKKEPC